MGYLCFNLFKSARYIFLAGLALSLAGTSLASELDEVLLLTQNINDQVRSSQKRVDNTTDATRQLRSEYKTVLKEIEALKVYNNQLRNQIAEQQRRIRELGESISKVTVIQRQITPLMLRMIDGLDRFIALDVPFQKKERTNRVARLKEIVKRSDVVVSEKFGAVLNAYQIESEYGRTMEAYSDVLEGTDKVVDFLRVGRIVLAYQTTDGEESGVWNQSSNQFEVLDSNYNSHIKQAIRIARKQAAVDLLLLPVSGPGNINDQ